MSEPNGRLARWLVGAAVAVSLVVAAGVAVISCGADGPARPTDPVLAQGQDVYKRSCASCHGANGQGVTGPKLNSGLVARYPDIAAQEKVVREGITANGMPAFDGRLSPEEIHAVSRYEREVLPGS